MTQATIDEPAPAPLPPGGNRRSLGGVIPWLRKFQSFFGLIGVILIAITISPNTADGSNMFLQERNLTIVVAQVSIIGVVALGMTFVILTGGIDLSVGSTLGLGATIAAIVLAKAAPHMNFGLHIGLAVLAAMAVAGTAGLLNGAVISGFGLQPFIVTLATMMGLRGLAKWLTNNNSITLFGGEGVTAVFANLLSEKVVVVGCFLLLAAIFAGLLKRTIFGRYVRAIGDNEKAAVYAGIPILRTKLWVYFLCGLLCGVAGVLYAAKVGQGNPNDGGGYELEAIAAVVIGGTSLAGGRGTVIGTIVGTLIIGILDNILGLRDVDPNLQMMIKAVIIVLAVWVQSPRRTA